MRFLMLAALGLCALPWVGCALPDERPGGEATISGRITDRATDGPVAGATIAIRGGDHPGTQSDSQGAYTVRVTWGAYQEGGQGILELGMQVLKSGYVPEDTSFIVLSPRTSRTIDVALSPTATIQR